MTTSTPHIAIPSLFRASVRRRGEHVALVGDARALTYAELDRDSDRLTSHLLGVGEIGDRIALLLPNDPDQIVAILAVLKAARVVVVLNRLDPEPRLAEIIADCAPAAILASEADVAMAARLAGKATAVVRIHPSPPSLVPVGTPDIVVPGDHPSFLTYTSGSTGRPKAVIMRHDSVVRSALSNIATWPVSPQDRVALVASLWGAQGNNTLWTALLAGACVAIFPVVDRGVTGLARWLRDERITVLATASSLFRHFTRTLEPEDRFPGVRLVKVSADAATWDDFRAFRRHFPNACFWHGMGASEVGGTIAFHVLTPADPEGDGPLPVGRPPPGLDVRIVDDAGNECPPGTVGALSVRSPALPAGYWRDPELTAIRFRDLPDGTRIFLSEDLARLDDDGRVVLAGRRDATHKVRGQRTDLAGVERGLVGLPGVLDAAAVIRTREGGESYLVAFVVPKPGAALTVRSLRTMARARMARNFIPSLFGIIDVLPRNASGKVDMSRLRDIELVALAGTAPPTTATERRLAAIWRRAFDIDQVGRADGFLDLGGDSLIAAVVAAGIDAETGVELPVSLFAENMRLSEMAAAVDTALAAPPRPAEPPLVSIAGRSRYPIAAWQRPFWGATDRGAHGRRQPQVVLFRIDGPVDHTTLQTALDAVVARHDVLRTRFDATDGEPTQIVEAPRPLVMNQIDLADAADPAAAVTALVTQESQTPFDFFCAPPLRATLVATAKDRHLLVMSAHHIITDAMSWSIFATDLGRFHTAAAEGGETPPPLEIQYGDYTVWHLQAFARSTSRTQFAIDRYAAILGDHAPFPGIGSLRRWWRPPADGPVTGPGDWQLSWGLRPETTARLDKLGDTHSATHYMVRLAAVAPVLSALTGAGTVAIRGVITARRRAFTQPMFGPFANTTPLIIRCDLSRTFREQIEEARQAVLLAQEFAEVPFDDVMAGLKARGLEAPSLFFWVHVTTPTPPLAVGDITLTQQINTVRLPVRGVVLLRFNHTDEEQGGTLAFDPCIYGKAAMRDLLDRFLRFTETAATNPDAPLGTLLERARVASWTRRS